MPRTLTAARARVRPEHEVEYLTLLASHRKSVEDRGGHFWVFRSRARAQTFLEFTESAAERVPAVVDVALAGRLRTLADYADDAAEAWDEVSLG